MRRIPLVLAVTIGLLAAGCGRREPPPPANTTLIALDGADWRNVLPLVRQGKLPALAALHRAGSSGTMLTNPDFRWSPVLWTSIATGKLPEKHGVTRFMARVPGMDRLIPTPSTVRQCGALWNFFSESERTVGFVGWWVTWPAEPVRGFIVSDHFSVSRFSLGREYGREPAPAYFESQTYPESLAVRLAPLRVPLEAIGRADIARFANLPESFTFPQDLRPFDKVAEFAIAHSVDRSHYNAGEMLLREEKPELFGVFFQGIDIMQHYFWEYIDPQNPLWSPTTESDLEIWGESIERYYRFADGMVAGIVAAGGETRSVMVVSDHGFLPSNERYEAKHISGEHRRQALFLWAGPGVAHGAAKDVDAVDVAPTLLAYHGLPVAEDFDGEPLLELMQPDWRTSRPLRTIPTWETGERPRGKLPASSVAEGLEERIRALGYIE